MDWIASDFVNQQKKQMKGMFEVAAANSDVAALKASTLYERTVRGANFKDGDKIWVLDQGSMAAINLK